MTLHKLPIKGLMTIQITNIYSGLRFTVSNCLFIYLLKENKCKLGYQVQLQIGSNGSVLPQAEDLSWASNLHFWLWYLNKVYYSGACVTSTLYFKVRVCTWYMYMRAKDIFFKKKMSRHNTVQYISFHFEYFNRFKSPSARIFCPYLDMEVL
ncbi:hypothetical protein PHYBLDRAFT_171208 [Phycomyces blakesleeanus NRRL 1555(-)]|uniref:Uncharacterized protein n=1 Tax=Phycomyces blakesleeanus (strain ATCC 8743b / DSM 1359 / FGSC 10004 / NBRC 33097 / NRRL 1555) TaxID=763407 RepID=A0A167LH91_PHYB8|nr:hypothetical protein PHYBLDRAFT_171208 [Phycomyces blakesleeanus NRRL 1555(-)]OAD70455.1 hypothetical protein PHYBLDRAFT_171208 [Phycomyces blakesleeanus NRRL 1555(-)]|eukprot:XP_018288495.1 hypothetical protein PHYBLDRAFT_171208 [Phycomyces blakesleeanus NRRL 1555(-)]